MTKSTRKQPTIDAERLARLPALTAGQHSHPYRGMGVMEAAAYIAGERFSDHPACVSPVIAAFCRRWNDTPGDAGATIRARLKTSLPRLIGTPGTPAEEEERGWLALDWLIRSALPWALTAAGLDAHAMTLSTLPPQMSRDALVSSAAARAAAWDAASAAARAAAWDAASAAASAAAWDAASAAARAAAWDAARAAAWAAAWDAASAAASAAARAAASAAAWDAARAAASAAARAAAWDAASAAARAAAWDAASAAAWDAAWDAASAAASAAARAAARAAAWDAARAAASAAARDAASAAARDAASAALQPLVEQSQASAWNLLDRLITVTDADDDNDDEEVLPTHAQD